MARGDLIKKMLASYQSGDDESFRSAASEVIDEERRKHHQLLADELDTIMAPADPTPERRMKVASLRPLPTARNEAPLVDLINPRRTLDSQILKPNVSARLDEVLDEYRRASALRSHGLQPVRSLLFVGPPGTGKSSSAEALASALGVPLARVNLPVVISSLLGETARNLAAIFEACRSEPWVLLFDEFDVIGRERSDTAEHGELKRVVASFMQLVDDYEGPALIIATTNHPAMLDDAVWRRFDDVIGFRLPAQREVEALVRGLFRRTKLSAPVREAAQMFKGWSQADIDTACRAAMKRAVMRDGESVTKGDLDGALRRLEERRRTIRTSRA